MEGEQRSVWPIALVDLLIPGLMSIVSKGQSNTTSVIPTLHGIISSCFLLGQEGDRHRGFLSILWSINKNTVNDHLSWLMEKKNSLFESSDPAEGHVNEWTAVWRKGLVVAVEIYCWAAESMLLQVNPQAWPCNYRWHLKHEAVCLLRCVFCSCQLQAVLFPPALKISSAYERHRLPFSEGGLRRVTFKKQHIFKEPILGEQQFTFPKPSGMGVSSFFQYFHTDILQ